MSDYSDKSDFEINKLVALALGLVVSGEYDECQIDDGSPWLKLFDPCNNSAASWNLMVDNGVDLKLFPVSKSYCASCHDDYEIYVLNESPGRAVAICFLMIKGG